MASRFGQKRVGRHSDSWWADREEHREHGDSLGEQLKEMSEHVARLQDTLRYERAKCTRLQLRGNQQEGELKRREQHTNRLKERMSQLTERHREKGPSIEVLNIPPGGRGKREPPIKSLRSTAKREEATLHLMLERREAELREAMKLRHSLTTLLHGLRVDMEHSLSDVLDVQDDSQTEDKRLDEAEGALGDHVTGGVVRSWRQVQSRLAEFSSEGHTSVGTDHEKLLARLDCELKDSQQLVRTQQQLLQDSFSSPVVSELADSYFLEEWERLQMRWAELDNQRWTFDRERKSFTEAAIRLSHERCDFEQHKASLLKQKYLCEPPRSSKGAPTNSRAEGSALNFCSLGPTGISGCLPITPSPTKLGTAALYGVTVHTPSTPELYSALNLSYNCRTSDDDHQSETWDGRADRMVHTLQIPPTDWSLESTFDDRW
ncbi:hypothetical protein CgunFtcFv8_022420 [Champsocephalus gunnari]|uniref:Afadin- and alpha-actinin-binding protein-like n=1 Tax=Champsocephalus gunnari TaxID=52237 RepID=A0AAN8DR82_CHAGU|nr:hypothetical protein CgunFtcFv8_022420 [Champsocephalus gunnari]